MKKVQVNAQVTAILSLFEFLGNVLYLLLLVYFKGTTFVSLFHAISLYFVVLPYAFLINTSDNKHRVVESGWTNVFKNLMGKPHGVSKVVENLLKNGGSLRSNANKLVTASIDAGDKDITITRQLGSGEQVSSSDENSIPNVPSSSDQPSGSIVPPTQVSEGQKSTVHQTLDIKTLVQNVNKHPLAQKQIKEAFMFVTDETKYLEIFKRLVALQEFCKGGKAVSELCLENEFKTSMTIDDERLTIKGHKKGKRLERTISILFEERRFNDHNIGEAISSTETVLEEKLKERSKIRTSILDQLDSSYDDTEKFESLMDQLISYEESCVQNL